MGEVRFGAGRPPTFADPGDMKTLMEDYFNNVPTRTVVLKDGTGVEMPLITITGLALHLGFESRQSFYDYEKKEEFSYIVKRARMFIENEYEAQLQKGNTVGAIFALKNMGWADKQDISLDATIESTNKNINANMSPEEATRIYQDLIND